jgi:hypothetical protein
MNSDLSNCSASVYSQLGTSDVVCLIAREETTSISNVTWLAKSSKWNDAGHLRTSLFIIRHPRSCDNRGHSIQSAEVRDGRYSPVSAREGAIELTRMLSLAHSAANALVAYT